MDRLTSFLWRVKLILLLYVYARSTTSPAPQIETPFGKIEGFLDKSNNGRPFFSFEGVRYAEPPVGSNRFKEPRPLKPWNGVWKANTKFECLQYQIIMGNKNDPIRGEEDCLYINIYTPNMEANLDVMVYIHGGAFMFGSGALYQPHYLLDRDVVVITINYRVGPLGFLSTEDDVVPGNNGLKDQIMALKWIKENVKYFGGNPNSITLISTSAGSASVHFHTMSAKSKGLFHRAISNSGCMMNPWTLMEKPLERARETASILGCDTSTSKKLVKCLRARPGKQLVAVTRQFQPWYSNPFAPFGVVVDGWASDPVLPKHPMQLMKEKAVNDVPYIFSHTAQEGLFTGFDYYNLENIKYLNQHWNELMPHILHYNFTLKPSILDKVSQSIRKEYLGDELLTRKNLRKLIDVLGHRMFIVDLEKCTRLHAAAAESPVYHYQFNYRGAHSFSEIITGSSENLGVSHGDDLMYFMRCFGDIQSTEGDRAMSKLMLDMFSSFARNGKPTIGVAWPRVSKNVEDPLKYLKINNATSLVVEEAQELGNRKFWDSLPFEENDNLFKSKEK